ncbi:MAG: hypothetical protein ACXW07_07465, partial [Nitrososphaeraceae archaeon]
GFLKLLFYNHIGYNTLKNLTFLFICQFFITRYDEIVFSIFNSLFQRFFTLSKKKLGCLPLIKWFVLLNGQR